ncbi:MAG: exodeoxyribonuclease VII small subunit [Balneolaceae bacterium]
MSKDSKEFDFEHSLGRLESIVQKLEDPEVSIEESVKLYEEGMELSARCSKILEGATLRIEEIRAGHSSEEPGKEE